MRLQCVRVCLYVGGKTLQTNDIQSILLAQIVLSEPLCCLHLNTCTPTKIVYSKNEYALRILFSMELPRLQKVFKSKRASQPCTQDTHTHTYAYLYKCLHGKP